MQNVSTTDYLIAKSRINKLNDMAMAYGTLKNWHELVLYKLGLAKDFVPNPRIPQSFSVDQNGRVMRFKFNDRYVAFGYDNSDDMTRVVYLAQETFADGQYSFIEPNGRDVVDIGASIGDTAVYFAAMGAKHVYAFEPSGSLCEKAERNIGLNGMQDRITLIDKGCGAVVDPDIRGEEREGAMSLKQVVEAYGLVDPVMKIDCEGCEYGVVLGADGETLRKFSRIVIEYHNGYENLAAKLVEAGFEVSKTAPRVFNARGKGSYLVGMLYAKRK